MNNPDDHVVTQKIFAATVAQTSDEKKVTGWRSSMAVLPGIGASLLPVGVCPACWPAYAGLLGSFGLGFLFETAYLLPMTVLFLALAMAALAYKAKTRKGYGPLFLGLAASAVLLAGKFIFETDAAMYVGIAILISASFWNSWPKKNVATEKDACPACASRQTGVLINNTSGGDK